MRIGNRKRANRGRNRNFVSSVRQADKMPRIYGHLQSLLLNQRSLDLEGDKQDSEIQIPSSSFQANQVQSEPLNLSVRKFSKFEERQQNQQSSWFEENFFKDLGGRSENNKLVVEKVTENTGVSAEKRIADESVKREDDDDDKPMSPEPKQLQNVGEELGKEEDEEDIFEREQDDQGREMIVLKH